MVRNPRALPAVAVSLAFALLSGCAGRDPRDPVTLTMSNKIAVALEVVFVPDFDMPDSPAAENVRSLALASGETRVIELPRGKWRITSRPTDKYEEEGRRVTEHEFHADGDVVIDDKLIRYHKTGPERAPVLPVERVRDPVDRNAR